MRPTTGTISPCPQQTSPVALSAYADGELDPGQAAALDAHVRACAACAAEIGALRTLRGTLKRRAAPSCPSTLRALAAATVARERATRERSRSGRLAWPFASAVALAAAAAILLGARQRTTATASAAAPVDRASVESLLDDLVALHARPLPPETTDPDDLPRFDTIVGVPVRRPSPQRFRAHFLGARLHALRERRTALLQYNLPNGHRVTFSLFDPRTLPVERAAGLHRRVIHEHPVYVGRIGGYSVAAAEQSGVGYALATDLGDDESAQLVLAAAH